MANYLYKHNNGRCGSLGEMKVRKPISNVENLLPRNGPRVSVPCKPPMFEIYQDEQGDKENVVFLKSQRTVICQKVQVPSAVDEEEDIYEDCVDDEKESPFEEYIEMNSFEEEDEISVSLPDEDDNTSISLTEADDSYLPPYVTDLYKCEGNYASPLSWEICLDDTQDSAELALTARENLYDCTEYSKDVYDYLRETEMRHLPHPKYMQRQPFINLEMRAILIDWLVDVALEYSVNNETLYLSVSLVDRFLSIRKIPKSILQLVGTTAMFIAGKYEETCGPKTKDFVYITDDSCSKEQIHRMEQIILTRLDFNVNVPTINCFLQYMCRATGLPESVLFLAQYLCELTLLEVETFLQFRPSAIAAAAICLANHTMGYEAWDAKLENTTGCNLQDLRDVMDCLHATYRNSPRNPHQAVRRKYNRTAYNGVSSLLPPGELFEKCPSVKYKRNSKKRLTNNP